MLAYVLALAVGLGSLGIYLAAFFFPELHRKNDFIWSGVGLFYALVLWVSAGRITGSVLLGQVAGVALLGWSITQTLSLRQQLTPRQQQTELPGASEVKNTVEEMSNLSLTKKLSQLRHRVTGTVTGVKDRVQGIAPTAATGEAMPAVSVPNAESAPVKNVLQPTEDNSRVQIIDNRTAIPEQPAVPPSPEADAEIEPALTEEEAIALAVETTLVSATPEASPDSSEPIRPHPPDPEIVEAAVRDAEEKHQKASPPDVEQPENPSPS